MYTRSRESSRSRLRILGAALVCAVWLGAGCSDNTSPSNSSTADVSLGDSSEEGDTFQSDIQDGDTRADLGEDVADDVAEDPADDVAEDPVDDSVEDVVEDIRGDIAEDADTTPPPPSPPNLVLVVLDDVGIETTEPWKTRIGARGEAAVTPTLDRLAREGAVVDTAWATPTCSPTRLGLHTGLYPSHGGILGPVGRITPLTETAPTLPRILGDTYRTGLFGKWHLGGDGTAPVTLGGWNHYSGQPSGGLSSYFDWERTVIDEEGNATTQPETTYATSSVVDDALAWMQGQDSNSPWLVMLAFNAPHTPFHIPPSNLRPSYPNARLDPNGDNSCDDNLGCHLAAIQALDTELGRFLRAAEDLDNDRDTVVVVLGDNGTLGSIIQPPFTRRHSKGTLYEGGVRVPLWIHGPPSIIPTPNTVHDGLAHASVDVFATLLELADAAIPEGTDGVSLLPVLRNPNISGRETLYTDGNSTVMNTTTEGAVMRNATHKVHVFDVTAPETYGCYDLSVDPDEQDDLMRGAPPAICGVLFEALRETRRGFED